MALEGSVVTSSYKNRSVTLSWKATPDIATNSDTLTWQIVGSGSAGGWVMVSELKAVIDGTTVYYRSSDNHTQCYNGTLLASGTIVLPHDDEGNKSFTASIQAGIYEWGINCSGSDSFTLNQIARASSITSASNTILGNNCSVTWTPASSSFRYKLKFAIGGWSDTTGYISPNTNKSYTYNQFLIPVSVANYITSSPSGTMTVYLYTYNGTTQIGSTSTKTFTVSVPESIVPTIDSLSLSIDNSANNVVEGWGICVSGYSKVKLDATGSGAYGSSISSFILDGTYSGNVGGSQLSYTGPILTSSGSRQFSVQAKDTRGRTSSVSTESVTVYAYSEPSISSFAVSRDSTNPESVSVRVDWDFASVNGNNTASCLLLYKKSSEEAWTTYGEILNGVETALENSFPEEFSYNFRAKVVDALGKPAQEEAFITTAAVLLDFREGGKGLGIGKIAERDALEVALESEFYEPAKFHSSVVSPTSSVSLTGGGSGSAKAGYVRIAHIGILGAHVNSPIIFDVCQRGSSNVYRISLLFADSTGTDPSISALTVSSDDTAFAQKSGAGAWDLYVKKSSADDEVAVVDMRYNVVYLDRKLTVDCSLDGYLASIPSGVISAEKATGITPISGGGTGAGTAAGALANLGGLPLAGGVMDDNAKVKFSGTSSLYRTGRDNAMIQRPNSVGDSGSYYPLISSKTVNGDWTQGTLGENIYFNYVTDADYNDGINTPAQRFWLGSDGNFYSPGGRTQIATGTLGAGASAMVYGYFNASVYKNLLILIRSYSYSGNLYSSFAVPALDDTWNFFLPSYNDFYRVKVIITGADDSMYVQAQMDSDYSGAICWIYGTM